ncbi:MAG: hypothetical protein M1831_002266 [Alyxoria varia]|nr:MAG: hypothetical protein M1831_002266 [Alyxoria varia]
MAPTVLKRMKHRVANTKLGERLLNHLSPCRAKAKSNAPPTGMDRASDTFEQVSTQEARPLEPRPRRLSAPGQENLSQSESPFFSKLPPELRFMIYELVLGGRHQLWRLFDNKILGPRLRLYTLCRRSGYKRHSTCPLRNNESLLAVLLVCHRLYYEAVDILYSANTFIIENDEFWHFRPELVPQTLWESVRSLKIWFQLARLEDVLKGVPKEQWEALWNQVSQATSLRELRVILCTYRKIEKPLWEQVYERVLEPTVKVKDLEHFELELNGVAKDVPYQTTTTQYKCNVKRSRNS